MTGAAGGGVFHPDFRIRPYWWEGAEPRGTDAALPDRVDVAIIGSGYCGLSAGIELARAGVRVAVLDSGLIGEGASSRNGGMVSGGVKLPDKLRGALGEERFARVMAASVASFHHVEALIAEEGIDADYRRCGRFTGAHSPGAYRRLQARAERLRAETGFAVHVVPPEAQGDEIGSRFYHGGMVVEESGGLDPARFLAGLRRIYEAAGGSLQARAGVRDITREGGRFRLRSAAGDLIAEQVFVATNGYSGPLLPWLQRRTIPIASYMIATEELPAELIARITPRERMLVDTKRILYYFRRSPDGRRILFGGRASFGRADEAASGATLFRFMCRIWPELRDRRITHAWKGNVGFSFDLAPHTGQRDGIRFAGCYQGTGVAMAGYLGHLSARAMLGDAPPVFDELPYPGHPLYRGRPWFLPIVGNYYRARDGLERITGL